MLNSAIVQYFTIKNMKMKIHDFESISNMISKVFGDDAVSINNDEIVKNIKNYSSCMILIARNFKMVIYDTGPKWP